MKSNKIPVILVATLITLSMVNADNVLKDIGKQTPVDIELYSKNPSTICSLEITPKNTPYQDVTKNPLPTISIKAGGYDNRKIDAILKGKYELEYQWKKDGKFVDSSLRSISIKAYHHRELTINKKVDLGFLLKAPDACK